MKYYKPVQRGVKHNCKNNAGQWRSITRRLMFNEKTFIIKTPSFWESHREEGVYNLSLRD